MAARYFADDYVRRYWRLPVNVRTPQGATCNATVSCNRYLMNVRDTDTSNFATTIRTMQTGISTVLSRAQAYSRTRPDLQVRTGPFGRTRVGKGTPDDMEHVLNTGVACGALPAVEAQLQNWANQSLGCDCTGFASAYFSYLGAMPIADSVNAGCGYFRSLAIRNNGAGALIWDFDAVRRDDVLLWMNEAGTETKRPGHIAVVYDKRPGELLIGESSGADDGAGHRGPRLNTKSWGAVTGARGRRSIKIGEGVIIVRVKS